MTASPLRYRRRPSRHRSAIAAFVGAAIICRAEGGCGHDDAEHYESHRDGNVRTIACRACDRYRGRCWEPNRAYRLNAVR